MKSSDLDKYRNLLRLYYDGETTPRQERELEAMALGADMELLPEDLKADTAMLRESARLSADAASFSATLDSITAQQQTSAPRRRRRIAPWILSAVSAAAVAAAVFYVGFSSGEKASTITPSAQTLVAKAESPAEPVPETAEEPHQISDPAPVPSAAQTTASASPSHQYSTAPKTTAPNSGTVEITDVEEASEIVNNALGLLARNLDISRSSIMQTSDIMQSTGEHLNQIL